jgi:hypothetical protein
VKVKPDASPRDVEALHHALGARVLRDIPQIRWQVLEVPRGKRDELRALYASETALFEHAELDRGRKPAYVPNDPMWPGMNHLVNIGVDIAWNTERGDPSIVIGVIDTGLETTHPDLAANVWTNPGEIAGNGLDDDQNGYVDDVHGYDFAYNDPIPNDVFGHGTACAGIIAAVQDNNLGVTGIAPLCRIAGIKTAIDSGYLYDSANVPGMIYCADQGFSVISMSFYSDDVTLAERDAIDYCWDHNVVPVAAAGNDARVFPYYPAAYENVISVAALDPALNKAGFSNWGTWVDVAAPGLSVSTTTTGGGYTTGFARHFRGLPARRGCGRAAAFVRAASDARADPRCVGKLVHSRLAGSARRIHGLRPHLGTGCARVPAGAVHHRRRALPLLRALRRQPGRGADDRCERGERRRTSPTARTSTSRRRPRCSRPRASRCPRSRATRNELQVPGSNMKLRAHGVAQQRSEPVPRVLASRRGPALRDERPRNVGPRQSGRDRRVPAELRTRRRKGDGERALRRLDLRGSRAPQGAHAEPQRGRARAAPQLRRDKRHRVDRAVRLVDGELPLRAVREHQQHRGDLRVRPTTR